MKALSGVDATFLHLETEQTPMHIASLSLFDLPPGYRRDFHAAVKRELGRRLHLVSVFHRKLAQMPLNFANPVWVEGLALLCGALAYTILLRAHQRHRWLVMGAAVLGYTAARLGSEAFGPRFGVFLAGLVVAAVSNAFARLKNKPAALVRIPGILLLVPGSVGFRSVFFVFDGHMMEGLDAASSLVILLTTLVAGLMFGDLLVPPRRTL